jgi:hypothetical protein
MIFSCDNQPSNEEVIKEEVVLGSNEIRVIQQNIALNTIIDEIVELHEITTERHDILYKMVWEEMYKYPDRLNRFDIEIMNNEEINKLRDIFNEMLAIDLKVARTKDEILSLEKRIVIE